MTSMVCIEGMLRTRSLIFFDSLILTYAWRAQSAAKHSLSLYIYHVIARTLGYSSIARTVGRAELDVRSGKSKINKQTKRF